MSAWRFASRHERLTGRHIVAVPVVLIALGVFIVLESGLL